MNRKVCGQGFVALVGAGPGEVSLLTLRAKELLECADVVVYDRLVSREVMQLIPKDTRLIDVGKENNHHKIPQEEINQILVCEAKKGGIVVRLKSGDPFVFGRGGEEVEALVMHKIPYEVVPGITSAIAAPAFAGFPVTHRDYCSSFHVITGHQKKNEELRIDFASLVKLQGTLIFLMGVRTLEDICQGLMNAGISQDMPAALVENGTRAYQRKLIATVGTLYHRAIEEGFQSPSIIIVGQVCALSEAFDWFSRRELFGQKIIVTSPVSASGRLSISLRGLGAQVLELPMIEIESLPVEAEMETLIPKMKEYQYLVFTSKNGVTIFFETLERLGKDGRSLGDMKVVAVGPSTAEMLKHYGILADVIPQNYNASCLIDELLLEINPSHKVLIMGAQKGTYELTEKLEKAQINYREVKLYRTVFLQQNEVDEATKEKVIVCFTSASTVEGFIENHPHLANVIGVCIGEQTANMAKKYGIDHYISKESTIASIVEKVREIQLQLNSENV